MKKNIGRKKERRKKMTISGTNVNERTFSLPSGKIVRMVASEATKQFLRQL